MVGHDPGRDSRIASRTLESTRTTTAMMGGRWAEMWVRHSSGQETYKRKVQHITQYKRIINLIPTCCALLVHEGPEASPSCSHWALPRTEPMVSVRHTRVGSIGYDCCGLVLVYLHHRICRADHKGLPTTLSSRLRNMEHVSTSPTFFQCPNVIRNRATTLEPNSLPRVLRQFQQDTLFANHQGCRDWLQSILGLFP